MISYYNVLGIQADAEDDEIVAAFRQKAQESLMDTEAYDLVQTAYETLKSPDKRKKYDEELSKESVGPSSSASGRSTSRSGTVPLRRALAPELLENDITRAFQPAICPICSHSNAVGETYCGECGFLLSTVPGADAEVVSESFGPSTPRLENSAGHVYPVKPGLNRIGRENADILILDKTVSRYHALLVCDEERHLFSVEDAGSSNGTKVNDIALSARSSHPLHNDDEIAFGSTKFKLITGEAVAPAEKGSASGSDDSPEIEITMPPTAVVPMARLTLQRGRGPQEVLLIPGTISIGRLPDNQISLPGDRFASGHHAQIVVEETVFRLIDVGSTNGSFLNGLRLTTNESIAMSDGDEIVIGSTVFQFQKIVKPSPAAKPSKEPESVSPLPDPPVSEDL